MTGHSRLRGRTRGGISKTAWSLLTGAVTMCINAEMHLSGGNVGLVRPNRGRREETPACGA